jgi:hypothetical protein
MKTQNDPVTESHVYAVLSVREIRALLRLASAESKKYYGRVAPQSTVSLCMSLCQDATVRSARDGGAQVVEILVGDQSLSHAAFTK